MTGALIMSTTLPTVIAMGVVAVTVKRIMPMQGRGGGKGVAHWHFRGRKETVKHIHPGGHLSHRHRGLTGYGRTKATLRR